MPLDGRRRDRKGSIASFQTTCSSRGCAGAPRAGRLGLGPVGVLLSAQPWLAQPLRLFLEFPPFVIKLLVSVSSVALWQELQHCGRNCWGRNYVALSLSFLRAVNAESFLPSFGILLTHHVLLAFPFLPWLSPLGTASREGGGRLMAEPFL